MKMSVAPVPFGSVTLETGNSLRPKMRSSVALVGSGCSSGRSLLSSSWSSASSAVWLTITVAVALIAGSRPTFRAVLMPPIGSLAMLVALSVFIAATSSAFSVITSFLANHWDRYANRFATLSASSSFETGRISAFLLRSSGEASTAF